jgi:hypothetical protein
MNIEINIYRDIDSGQLRFNCINEKSSYSSGITKEEELDGLIGEERFLREKLLSYISQLNFRNIALEVR